jgi:triacylglycerol lipase
MGNVNDIEPDDIKSIPTFRAAYSDRTALLMAKLAHRAYERFDRDDGAFATFSDVFKRLGLECEKLVHADSGTAGFVLAGPELIVVVFRGTQDLLDWRTNVNAAWTELQGGVKVHSGFVRAYYTIRDGLFASVIRLLKAKSRPVYITGHSLGGALAVMATAELANHDEAEVRDSIAACYTFGCPKAGDRTFDQYVKVPLYRITNGVDLVPAVPPIFSGYKHVGDTRYFGKPGISPLRRPPNVFQKLWRTFWGLLQIWRTRAIIGIADHSMNVYVAKLDAWVRAATEEAQERRKATADRTL